MGSTQRSTRRHVWHPIPRLTHRKTHTSPERERWDQRNDRRDAMCGIRSPGLRRGLVWGRMKRAEDAASQDP